jgi:O-antigen ligase
MDHIVSAPYQSQGSVLITAGRPSFALSRSGFLCFLLGLTPITAGRTPDAASFLRIPFVSDYLLSYYDVAVCIGCLALVWKGGFSLDRREKKLYWAVAFVVLTRVISLVFASGVSIGQAISVLRYVETLASILLLANLLTFTMNRTYFVWGLFAGAITESIGGLFNFVSSGGEARAVWLGFDNYKLLVFALIACLLLLAERQSYLWKTLLVLLLFVEIVATGTRTALFLIFVTLVPLYWTRRRAMAKWLLAVLVLGLFGTVSVLLVLPAAQDTFTGRVDQLSEGTGTVGLRIILWEMAGAAFLSHPMTGIGSGGFARQQNTLWLEINDVYESGYESKYETLSTHNTVLGIAAETGIVGLIAYFIWAVAVVKVCIKGIELEKIFNDPYMLAACVCVLAMVAEDWWAQASFLAGPTCLLGFILGWSRSARREPLPTMASTG